MDRDDAVDARRGATHTIDKNAKQFGWDDVKNPMFDIRARLFCKGLKAFTGSADSVEHLALVRGGILLAQLVHRVLVPVRHAGIRRANLAALFVFGLKN